MFRFTIRELFLLTLVAALSTGWWIDHSRLSQLWLNAKRMGEHDHWAAEAFTYVTRSNSRHGSILMTRESPTSASSTYDFGIEVLQFATGVGDLELPIDATLLGIAGLVPGSRFRLQGWEVAQPAAFQALTSE